MLGEETGPIDQIQHPDSYLNSSCFELNTHLTKLVLVLIVFVINYNFCSGQCELQICLISNCNKKILNLFGGL